jgi:hypothetical protein
MAFLILFRPVCNTSSIENDRRDSDDDNKVQHMRPIEVQSKQLMAEISQELVLGLSRVPQLLYRVRHRRRPIRNDVQLRDCRGATQLVDSPKLEIHVD